MNIEIFLKFNIEHITILYRISYKLYKTCCCQNLTKSKKKVHNNDVNVNDYYNDDGNNNNNDIKTRHLWQTMKINKILFFFLRKH